MQACAFSKKNGESFLKPVIVLHVTYTCNQRRHFPHQCRIKSCLKIKTVLFYDVVVKDGSLAVLFGPLTLARAGVGVDATPMSFSGMASEPLGGSR